MFAAELRVKKAVTPLSRNAVKTIGYGFVRVRTQTISGLMMSAMISMQLSSTDRMRT